MIGLLFVSVSLGLSNCAAAIGIGLSGADRRVRLQMALSFGLFEALMPIIGLVIGRALVGPIGHVGNLIGPALLILTGIYTIWTCVRVDSSVNDPISTDASSRYTFQRLLVAGFALSIDNLVVGFALGLYHLPVLLAAGVIAIVSVGMSLIGLELGSRIGTRFERWSEELGGAVLILVGLALAAGLIG